MHRLKIMAVVRRVYGVLLDAPLLFRAAGISFVALAVANFAEAIVVPGPGALWHIMATLVSLVSVVVYFVAFAACAVKIHRAILLAESPTLTATTGLEWRYIKRSLWVILPLGAGIAVIVISLSFTGALEFTRTVATRPLDLTWFTLAWGAVLFIVIVPPALSLPALAIGRVAFGIRAGYAAARDNILGLFCIYLLSALLPNQVLRFVAIGMQDGIVGIIPATSLAAKVGGAAVTSGQTMVTTVMWAAMLSCAYAGLVEGRREFADERSVDH